VHIQKAGHWPEPAARSQRALVTGEAARFQLEKPRAFIDPPRACIEPPGAVERFSVNIIVLM
jgi:hypothetical protein